MARQARIEFPGALYHVISRGIERKPLFRDETDREKYLELLAALPGRFDIRLYAFCLMSNHVHLAFEAGRIPLSRIMRSLNSSYAAYFNRLHRRTGYLFQGRYKAFVVDEEEYLLGLVRYIHENPVASGLAGKPGDYRWSSHRLYMGKSPKWLSADQVLAHFGRRRSVARRNFSAFFREPEERPYGKARRYVQTIVGEEGFASQVLERAEPEELLVRRVEPANLLRWVAGQEKFDLAALRGPSRRRDLTEARALCGYLARDVARMPLTKIAREVGRDGSTLWRDVRELEARMKVSKPLRDRVQRLASRFAAWGNTT